MELGKEKLQRFLETVKRSSRSREFVEEWRKDGGIEGLMKILREPNDASLLGYSLSALANCILLDDTSSKIVKEKGGVNYLADILKSLEEPQLINRAARAFANLFSKEDITDEVKVLEIVKTLLQRTVEITDTLCLQSLIRALQKVCEKPTLKLEVVRSDYFKRVLECLTSQDNELRVATLKLIQSLVGRLNDEITCRIIEFGGVESIIQSCSTLASDKRELGVSCLAILTNHPAVRVSLPSIGGIEFFRQEIKSLGLTKSFSASLQALCLCAKEAVNRNRIARCGALGDMVRILNSDDHAEFFPDIVTALVWFLFDEASIKIMVQGNVVKGLIGYFLKLTECKISQHEGITENDNSKQGVQSDSLVGENSDAQVTSQSTKQCSEPHVNEGVDAVDEDKVPCSTERSQLGTSPILLHYSQPWPFSPGWSISSPETSPPGARSPTWGYGQTSPPVCYSPRILNHAYSPSSPSYDLFPEAQTSDLGNAGVYAPHSSPSGADCFPSALSPPRVDIANQSPTPGDTLPNAHCSTRTSLSGRNVTFEVDQYYGSADGVSAMIHGRRGPIHDVLLLLSRLSQMTDPSRILVNTFCMEALLNYINTNKKPEQKAVRLLNRLTLNPNCFEAFFKHNLVIKIHLVLGKCYTVQELVKTLDFARDNSELKSRQGLPCGNEVGVKINEEECKTIDKEKQGKSEDMYSEDAKEDIFNRPRNRIPSLDSQRACDLLLSNLKAQTESSFGKGVLTHVMLTGSQSEKEIHAIALPLLCRSTSLLRKMFLELRGLKLLLGLIGNDDSSSEMFALACESLSALCSLAGVSVLSTIDETSPVEAICDQEKAADEVQIKESSFSDATATIQEDERKISSTLGQKRHDDSPETTPCKKRRCGTSTCSEDDQGIICIFQLDSGVHAEVNQRLLTSFSPVFEAMLSNKYADVSKDLIQVKGVNEKPFLLMLHHLSGCVIDLDKNCCQETCVFPGRVFVKEDRARLSCKDSFQSLPSMFETCGDEVNPNLAALTVIELFICCERYMVDNLKERCEEWLIKKVNDLNVVDFYLLGRQNNGVKLFDYCQKYLFLCIKDPWQRVKSVMEIVQSIEQGFFLSRLEQLITKHLLMK